MTFEEMAREAAHAADDAVTQAMNKYKEGGVVDEDDLTGVLVGRLDSALDGQIGGLTWNTTIVRHRRGRAAEERRIGADLVIHVSLDTSTERYSKGVLVQAKRVEPDDRMKQAEHDELTRQCRRLDLYHICNWTSYRFFLELFRCPIGDPKITSARVDDLPVPYALKISATGDLSDHDSPLANPSK